MGISEIVSTRYNPNQITTDGPYMCARKWHHVFNVLLGGCIFGALLAVYTVTAPSSPHAFTAAALLSGPFVLLVSRVIEWIHPTDNQPLTLWQHAADAITDGVCYSFVGTVGNRLSASLVVAFIVAAGYVIAYFVCRPGARP